MINKSNINQSTTLIPSRLMCARWALGFISIDFFSCLKPAPIKATPPVNCYIGNLLQEGQKSALSCSRERGRDHYMAWCWFVTRSHDVQVIPPWQSLVTFSHYHLKPYHPTYRTSFQVFTDPPFRSSMVHINIYFFGEGKQSILWKKCAAGQIFYGKKCAAGKTYQSKCAAGQNFWPSPIGYSVLLI